MPGDEVGVDGVGVDDAVVALSRGAVVGIPTDTVYGLAVDPRHPRATDDLFALKRRPNTVELPVLVADVAQADALAGPDGLSPLARRLADRFWPGSLTIVVGRRPGIDWEIGGDGSSIGLRCPAHAIALRLCQRVGPLATTSANRHGESPITTAAAVAREFGDAVALVVDGGVCDGIPSTVIDLTGGALRCVREGAVPWADVQRSAASD
jgi:L-threonylcarbamoyladenylate synthase